MALSILSPVYYCPPVAVLGLHPLLRIPSFESTYNTEFLFFQRTRLVPAWQAHDICLILPLAITSVLPLFLHFPHHLPMISLKYLIPS